MDREALGRRLKALRTERGLSLAQLARSIDISASFLSLVESGRSDITISRLVRIADYFGIEIAELIDRPTAEPIPIEVIRSGEANLIHSPEEHVDAMVLGHSHWSISPVIADYQAGGQVEVEGFADHESFFYVISGTFEIAVEGQDPTRLRRGDGAIIRGGSLKRIVNAGKGAGRLLSVGAPVSPAG